MQRRVFLTSTSIAVAASLLTACGFRLRGAVNYSFQSLFLNASEGSLFARDLQRALESAKINVLRAPAKQQDAQVVFELLQEQQDRVIVSQTASGKVTEVQLRLHVSYQLHGVKSQRESEIVKLTQVRDMNYDETVALSKEGEEDMLRKDMRTDLVMQVVRRLAAI